MTLAIDINKVGFFHVANDQSSAIKSLAEHLEAERDRLRDCLVVLPEAFNFWPYNRKNGYLDTSIRDCLKKLSIRFKVAFVTGLIETEMAKKN